MTDEEYRELLAECTRKAEAEKEQEDQSMKKNMLVFDTTNLTEPDSDGRPAVRIEGVEAGKADTQEVAAASEYDTQEPCSRCGRRFDCLDSFMDHDCNEHRAAEAAARIRELEIQLSVANGKIADLRDANERAVKILVEEANKKLAEVEARLKEAEGSGEALREMLAKYFNTNIEDIPTAVQGLINSATYSDWRSLDSLERYMEAKERATAAESRCATLEAALKAKQALEDFEWCSDCQPEPNCGLWHGKCRGDCNHKCHDDYHKLTLVDAEAQAALRAEGEESEVEG